MITLIIVDCQNDFISGTMAVKGAKQVIDNIKKFITTNVSKLSKVIFTVDWHPFNHCSFKRNGGQWPTHCVQYTPGACIEPKLLKHVQSFNNLPYEVSTKGELPEIERYGAFADIDYRQDFLGTVYYMDSVVTMDAETEPIVCGIAGDYCVKETIKNLMEHSIVPKVLLSGVASIDDGSKFKEFITNNNLTIVE